MARGRLISSAKLHNTEGTIYFVLFIFIEDDHFVLAAQSIPALQILTNFMTSPMSSYHSPQYVPKFYHTSAINFTFFTQSNEIGKYYHAISPASREQKQHGKQKLGANHSQHHTHWLQFIPFSVSAKYWGCSWNDLFTPLAHPLRRIRLCCWY